MDGTHTNSMFTDAGPIVLDAVDEMIKTGRFDEIYRTAHGDTDRIPWADMKPNPMLVTWLNAVAPGVIRAGARVAVVGCGLGDDVNELHARGYDVVGFDVSDTAIQWARERFPAIADSFVQADALSLPGRMVHRFDLVVEVYTLQSVLPESRQPIADAIVALAHPRNGHIIAIARARSEDMPLNDFAGPPWPLTKLELETLMANAGAKPIRSTDEFHDDEVPPKPRLRGTFVVG